MKNYKLLLKTVAIFQFIFAGIHAVTLFISPPPANETEKELFRLMDTYLFDFGAGFQRTMNELTLVFSASLCLLYAFAGTLNWFLLSRQAEQGLIKGVIILNTVTFGITFFLCVAFAFLPPIILAGIVWLFLLLSVFALNRRST